MQWPLRAHWGATEGCAQPDDASRADAAPAATATSRTWRTTAHVDPHRQLRPPAGGGERARRAPRRPGTAPRLAGAAGREDAALLVTELVANVIDHVGGEAQLTVEL